MNAKCFAAFFAIVLVMGLKSSVTNAQTPQLRRSMFNDALVQRSTHHPNQPRGLIPPPPDTGAPGSRSGAASRAAQRLIGQPEVWGGENRVSHTSEKYPFKL